MYYIYGIIVIIIFIYTVYTLFKIDNGHIKDSKGYGLPNEKVSKLLDRIVWSNHHIGRYPRYLRALFYAIVIGFVTNIVVTEKVDPKILIENIFVVWIVVVMLNSYFTFHSDKYNSYFIDNNIRHIRKKLGIPNIEKVETLDINDTTNFNREHDCIQYAYKYVK